MNVKQSYQKTDGPMLSQKRRHSLPAGFLILLLCMGNGWRLDAETQHEEPFAGLVQRVVDAVVRNSDPNDMIVVLPPLVPIINQPGARGSSPASEEIADRIVQALRPLRPRILNGPAIVQYLRQVYIGTQSYQDAASGLSLGEGTGATVVVAGEIAVKKTRDMRTRNTVTTYAVNMVAKRADKAELIFDVTVPYTKRTDEGRMIADGSGFNGNPMVPYGANPGAQPELAADPEDIFQAHMERLKKMLAEFLVKELQSCIPRSRNGAGILPIRNDTNGKRSLISEKILQVIRSSIGGISPDRLNKMLNRELYCLSDFEYKRLDADTMKRMDVPAAVESSFTAVEGSGQIMLEIACYIAAQPDREVVFRGNIRDRRLRAYLDAGLEKELPELGCNINIDPAHLEDMLNDRILLAVTELLDKHREGLKGHTVKVLPVLLPSMEQALIVLDKLCENLENERLRIMRLAHENSNWTDEGALANKYGDKALRVRIYDDGLNDHESYNAAFRDAIINIDHNLACLKQSIFCEQVSKNLHGELDANERFDGFTLLPPFRSVVDSRNMGRIGRRLGKNMRGIDFGKQHDRCLLIEVRRAGGTRVAVRAVILDADTRTTSNPVQVKVGERGGKALLDFVSREDKDEINFKWILKKASKPDDDKVTKIGAAKNEAASKTAVKAVTNLKLPPKPNAVQVFPLPVTHPDAQKKSAPVQAPAKTPVVKAPVLEAGAGQQDPKPIDSIHRRGDSKPAPGLIAGSPKSPDKIASKTLDKGKTVASLPTPETAPKKAAKSDQKDAPKEESPEAKLKQALDIVNKLSPKVDGNPGAETKGSGAGITSLIVKIAVLCLALFGVYAVVGPTLQKKMRGRGNRSAKAGAAEEGGSHVE